MRYAQTVLVAVAATVWCAQVSARAEPIGTAFTYQGQLKQAGVPVNGAANFVFELWDAETGGAMVDSRDLDSVEVVDGLFTVQLDFGAAAFDGDARWLGIDVEFPSGAGNWTTLAPRQPLTATPFAAYALFGPGSGGLWTASGDDIYNNNPGGVGIGTTIPASMLDVQSTEGTHGIMSVVPWIAVWGHRTATTGTYPAIHGECDSEAASGTAIRGIMTSTSPGSSSSAVRGINKGTGAAGIGVYGSQDGSGYGVYGSAPDGRGVFGSSTDGIGVYGSASGTSGEYYGVYGTAPHTGVCGVAAGGRSSSYGVRAIAEQANTNTNYGIYARAENAADYNFAGRFFGLVSVIGHLSKSSGSFEIDHPLDPANKYLRHSFVESPDMMNVYNGNVVTDANGYADITLPEWFETLNRDFRYQLTVIDEPDGDTFVQAKVVRGVRENRFRIRTSVSGTTVSWQVTGIRQDRWANTHRVQVEEEKREKERGSYLHPELYDMPPERRVDLWLEATVRQERAADVETRGQDQD